MNKNKFLYILISCLVCVSVFAGKGELNEPPKLDGLKQGGSVGAASPMPAHLLGHFVLMSTKGGRSFVALSEIKYGDLPFESNRIFSRNMPYFYIDQVVDKPENIKLISVFATEPRVWGKATETHQTKLMPVEMIYIDLKTGRYYQTKFILESFVPNSFDYISHTYVDLSSIQTAEISEEKSLLKNRSIYSRLRFTGVKNSSEQISGLLFETDQDVELKKFALFAEDLEKYPEDLSVVKVREYHNDELYRRELYQVKDFKIYKILLYSESKKQIYEASLSYYPGTNSPDLANYTELDLVDENSRRIRFSQEFLEFGSDQVSSYKSFRFISKCKSSAK